jgi:hypothetical protein
MGGPGVRSQIKRGMKLTSRGTFPEDRQVKWTVMAFMRVKVAPRIHLESLKQTRPPKDARYLMPGVQDRATLGHQGRRQHEFTAVNVHGAGHVHPPARACLHWAGAVRHRPRCSVDSRTCSSVAGMRRVDRNP